MSALEQRARNRTWEMPNAQNEHYLDLSVKTAARAAMRHPSMTAADMASVGDEVEGLLNFVERASAHASAHCVALLGDADALAARVASDTRAADACVADIAALEKEVAAEEVRRGRRAVYDALASVILEQVDRGECLAKIADEVESGRRLEDEGTALRAEQVNAKREFMLVLQGADDMEAYAQSEREKSKAKEGAAENGAAGELKKTGDGDAEMADA